MINSEPLPDEYTQVAKRVARDLVLNALDDLSGIAPACDLILRALRQKDQATAVMYADRRMPHAVYAEVVRLIDVMTAALDKDEQWGKPIVTLTTSL